MTWFRCGGSGMPADLKNRMNAVFNKKFGTAVDYPAEGWPDDVNLMGPLPEKTIVSSPIADFSDGADDVPTKSLIVTIPPTLSGVSAITENRNGGNFIELYTRSSHNGVDYSINADGSLHRYGTASGNSFNNGNATNYNNCPYKFHAGTYTLSVDGNINNNTFVSLGIFLKSGASFTSQGVTGVGSVTFTVSEDFGAWYYCKLNNGVTVNDDVYIWLYAGSTAHAYEPYQTPTQYTASLGRTIYGGQVDIVNGVGTADCSVPIALNSLTWTKTTIGGHDCFFANLPNGYIGSGSSYVDGVCDDYAITTDGNMGTDKTIRFYFNSSFNFSRVSIRDDQYASYTGAQFKEAVTGNIVYQLAESAQTDFTFTGQEIPTRLGYNAFWSDQGDTEVTYRADISLALQAVSGSRGLMMASRPMIEPANGDQGSEESTENNIETEGDENAR